MISGILLAAGAGVRFGGRKLLQRLPDGTPIGVASLRTLQAALVRSVAVVRAGDTELRKLLSAEGVPVIDCADAVLGMGHSLAAGIAYESGSSGWVVALGDMPCIHPGTITKVALELERGAGIVVPIFAGRRGHPVGFSSVFREQLVGLRGDAGARGILSAHPTSIRQLEVDDPGILQDVDIPEDVQRLTQP
ncbi:MAG TPA: nucleotidyltransferase family protein [Burkholderiales bacterium]|nr:nucleotidyltransferase family protein [Anaeromyxobacteraceae bacterium]HTT39924.1 nucleotidyltransferase family protein [Burkholderiales bacterium]